MIKFLRTDKHSGYEIGNIWSLNMFLLLIISLNKTQGLFKIERVKDFSQGLRSLQEVLLNITGFRVDLFSVR